MRNIEGHCLCGSVTYSADSEPAMIVICHCTDCQRQSGSPFSVNVLVPVDKVRMEGETLTQYVINGDSGKTVIRNFCNRCGSPLSTVMEAFGNLAAIKSGTLKDSSWVKPTIQIWCDSGRPWGILDDTIPKTGRNPPV